MANLKLPDLDTRSLRDIVEENYRRYNFKSFASRWAFVGEHSLPREELVTFFKKTTQAVNGGYCDIYVTGILLVYDHYFLHIIEGSEDSIHRHIRFLFQREEQWKKDMQKKDEEAAAEEDVGLTVIMPDETTKNVDRKIFGRMKSLMLWDCIKNRLFSDWRALTARPPSLVGKLDIYAPMQEHLEQLKICLNKITKLFALAVFDPHLSFEGMGAADPKMDALPESALLDFLLQSEYILDLRNTAALHRRVDDYLLYFEEVWPLPTHFTPRLLYKLKIDDSFVEPLPVMPWEKVKKETEDDDQKGSNGSQDEGSTSSSD